MPGRKPDTTYRSDDLDRHNIGDGITVFVDPDGNTILSWSNHTFHIPAKQVAGVTAVMLGTAIGIDPEQDWADAATEARRVTLARRARGER